MWLVWVMGLHHQFLRPVLILGWSWDWRLHVGLAWAKTSHCLMSVARLGKGEGNGEECWGFGMSLVLFPPLCLYFPVVYLWLLVSFYRLLSLILSIFLSFCVWLSLSPSDQLLPSIPQYLLYSVQELGSDWSMYLFIIIFAAVLVSYQASKTSCVALLLRNNRSCLNHSPL